MMINQLRLEIANQVLVFLHPEQQLQLTVKNNRVCARWRNSKGWSEKLWLCRSGSFYPSINRQISAGGTRIVATSQLVRWVQGKSCLPIQQWLFWCSDLIGLHPKEKILPLLESSDYPKEYECVWCKAKGDIIDWYTIGRKEGAGCFNQCEPIKAALEKQWRKR